MKKLFILFTLTLFSASLLAQNGSFISKEKEEKILKDAAKEFRKKLWVKNHDHVTSYIKKIQTKDLLNFIDSDQNNAQEKLDSEELLSLTICQLDYKCQVYAVDLSSEYWGGYGTETYWLMLDRKSGDYTTVFHVTYTE